jgi:hypothetical protein
MRATTGLVLALAAAAAGCQALGLREETSKDLSSNNTRSGSELDLDAPHKIQVVQFAPDFRKAPGAVGLVLLNEGVPEEFLSFEVEFGYPAPPGSITPYIPYFESVDIADWKTGEKMERTVPGQAGNPNPPLFARIITTRGADVRATADRETSSSGLRKGTTLLAGAVEVVEVTGNLVPPLGEKPTFAFTIENVSDKEIGELRYLVQIYSREGKILSLGRLFSRPQPIGKPLGGKGSRVTVEVKGLENAENLAAGRPVLRLFQ